MKKINIAITGCMGRMGQQLIKSSKSAKNFKLASITENRLVNKKIKIGITFNLSRLIMRLKAPYASNQKKGPPIP